MSYEVSEPIQNSPFEKPVRYWYIQEGEEPELRTGRRPPVVFPPPDQREEWTETALLHRSKEYPTGYELALANLIRERLDAWRQGYAGVVKPPDSEGPICGRRWTPSGSRYWTG